MNNLQETNKNTVKALSIRFERVNKKFGSHSALKEVSFTIPAGARAVLLGPSGGGKSTALRLIAGLENVTDGEIWIGEEKATHMDPGDRNVAMVFQNYALYPHMTVWDNITFALRMAKIPRSEIERRVDQALRLLDMKGLEKRLPRELSGGQRQRVALARAIVKEAPIVLMDEPLSNLDAKLRVKARMELLELQKKLGFTLVYVTHDQTEALAIGTHIFVLANGTLLQSGTNQDLYHQPTNIFVATFIGSPAMNIWKVRYDQGHVFFDEDCDKNLGERLSMSVPIGIQESLESHFSSDASKEDRTFVMGVRPEHIKIMHPSQTMAYQSEQKEEDFHFFTSDDERAYVKVQVSMIESVGRERYVHAQFNDKNVTVIEPVLASHGGATSIKLNDKISISFRWDDVHWFSAKDGSRIVF